MTCVPCIPPSEAWKYQTNLTLIGSGPLAGVALVHVDQTDVANPGCCRWSCGMVTFSTPAIR
jgi:hypothetical protein